MQLEARVRQPLSEAVDGCCVVVVEVGSRGKQFDGLESMRGDVDEMIARQP